MEPPSSSSTCQHPAENSTCSSSGASSSTKNRVQRYCPRQKDIRFELECEWEDCTKVLDDMDAYLRHVDEHLNSACDLQCKWRLCDSDELETDDDLKRHVRFHAFHAKLKQIGVNVLKSLQERQNSSASANSSSKAPECTVDEHKRNSIPDVPLNFQCAWEKCDYSTDNIEFFYRHIRQQHVEVYQSGDKFPPKGMKCPWRDCEIFISSRFRLGEHIKTHSVEKAVACPNCGTLFSTFTKFLDHCNRSSKIKDNDLRYQCTICCKIFARNNLLKDHMRKHVNKFKCPICEMRCVDKYDLNKHILYKHSKMKPFKCNSCEYSCKTPQDLKKHISLIHTERDEYSCSQCEFKTKDINYYKRHLVKFHLCQNGEKSSSIMNETNESVLQYSSSYMCHVCNKIYSMGATLTRHLKDQHNIQWQSGYSRFRYKLEPDGYFRLQTVRYDSIELVEELNRQQQQKEQQQQQQYQEQIEREQLVDQLQLEQQQPQHFSHLESINEEMNGENSSGEIVGLIQLEEAAAASDEPVDDTVVNTAFGQLISVIEEFVVTDSSPIQEVNADNTDTTSSSFQLSSTNTNTSDAIDLENIFSSSFNFSCLTKNSFDTIHY